MRKGGDRCVLSIITLVRSCVCADGSVSVSLSSFQGADGAAGNGTEGCHGFQVGS